jgi:hypothetical protein
MSFLAAVANKNNAVQAETPKEQIESITNQLTKEEIKLILEVMKNSTFKGELVEILYSTIVKLQSQYLDKQEN